LHREAAPAVTERKGLETFKYALPVVKPCARYVQRDMRVLYQLCVAPLPVLSHSTLWAPHPPHACTCTHLPCIPHMRVCTLVTKAQRGPVQRGSARLQPCRCGRQLPAECERKVQTCIHACSCTAELPLWLCAVKEKAAPIQHMLERSKLLIRPSVFCALYTEMTEESRNGRGTHYVCVV
jgi:hypothetical protein